MAPPSLSSLIPSSAASSEPTTGSHHSSAYFYNPNINCPVFHSILDPSDAIPPERFSFWDHDAVATGDNWELLGCRHGRVLLFSRARLEFTVWNPVTGDRHCVAVPPELDDEELVVVTGAVLRAAGDQGHVHGGECHTNSFQVALIAYFSDEPEWFGCVYSSETGEWDLSSAAFPDMDGIMTPGILSGDSLYWLYCEIDFGILKFDLGSPSLAVIEIPLDLDTEYDHNVCVLRTEDGGVGLAILTNFRLHLWERKIDCDGAARWVLQKTVKLEEITGLSRMEKEDVMIRGYEEDGAVIFLWTDSVFFMVQLDSMQFTKLGQSNLITASFCHPYRNFLC